METDSTDDVPHLPSSWPLVGCWVDQFSAMTNMFFAAMVICAICGRCALTDICLLDALIAVNCHGCTHAQFTVRLHTPASTHIAGRHWAAHRQLRHL